MKFNRSHILYSEAVLEAPAAGGSGGPAVVSPAVAAPAVAEPAAGSGGATTDAAGAAAKPWVSSDGSLAEGWESNLPDAFSAYRDTAKNFKSVPDLVKSVVELRKSGPGYPTAESTPDQIARFREVAQVPKEPAGYGLAAPEALPEGVSWDPAVADKFAAVAHQHHIPAPGMKALVAAQLEIEAARATQFRDAQAAQQKAAQDSLVAEWRGDFDANASTVRHFTAKLAETSKVSPEDAARLASDPAFARIALSMANLTKEGGARLPAGIGELRSSAQRAKEIMAGKDPEWGAKYQEGNLEAMQLVSTLLDESKK